MKRFLVCMMVVLISLGVVAVMGGCGGGGGGGGDGTPQSSSAYAGSNIPSVIDSTTVGDYSGLLSDIGDVMGMVQYVLLETATDTSTSTEGESWGGEFSVDGSGGGTYSESWDGHDWYTYTQDGDLTTNERDYKYLWEGSFNSFVDSGTDYPGILQGEGSFYYKEESASASSTVGPLALAPAGTQSGSDYVNYHGFEVVPEWVPDYTYSLDGYLDQKYDADYVAGLCDSTLDADISYSEVTSSSAAYYGLLGAKATVAYDGSDSTVTGSGTLCGEGDAELSFEGCVDFDIDVVWEDTQICGELPDGFPDSGTIVVSTMNAKVMYDFSATSSPGCWNSLLDATSDGAYEYSVLDGPGCNF